MTAGGKKVAGHLAIECFEKVIKSLNLVGKEWLGIYCTLMWYEHGVPHIIDADKLKDSAWRDRALKVEQYIARHLGCSPEDVKKNCDMLMHTPQYKGKQRQNPLGIAFVATIKHLFEMAVSGKEQYLFDDEVNPRNFWPGITIQGRSREPRIDVILLKKSKPVAVFSAKWSLRHDRLSDIINECPVYKQAAYTLNRINLKYYVVTNEFDPARLSKVIEDPCVDGVIHVHKPLLVDVLDLDGRLDKLIDLSVFLEKIKETTK